MWLRSLIRPRRPWHRLWCQDHPSGLGWLLPGGHVGLLGGQTLCHYALSLLHFSHCFLSKWCQWADFCSVNWSWQVLHSCLLRCRCRALHRREIFVSFHTLSCLIKSLFCLVCLGLIISGSGRQLVASDICISKIHTKIVSLVCVPGGLEQTQKSTYQAKIESRPDKGYDGKRI